MFLNKFFVSATNLENVKVALVLTFFYHGVNTYYLSLETMINSTGDHEGA